MDQGKKLRIAFLLPINGLTGGVFVVYAHAAALRARGHDVTLVFEEFRPESGFASFGKIDLPYCKLNELPEGVRFDVAIATWWKTFFWLPRIAADHHFYFVQSDERRFYSAHDERNPDWVACTYSFPEIGVLTVARWIQSKLRDEFGLEIEYAPNGVDTRVFSQSVAPLAPPGRKYRVLIEGPGGIGFKRIEDAFAITRVFDDIEVWYVNSDGVVRPEWRFDRLFSSVPFAEMPAIYRSCDTLIKVSAVEGFFGPPLEMMACGGTCVVSDVTGHDEYVVDGTNALVIPIGDVEAGRRALARLIQGKALRDKLSAEGLKTAAAFDWRVQFPRFEAALLALVERVPPVPKPTLELIERLGRLERSMDREIGRLRGRLAIKVADRLEDRFPGSMTAMKGAIRGLNRLGKRWLR